MQGLLFIVLPEEDVADSSKYSSIVGKFGQEDLIPFKSLLGSANDLIDVGDLEDGFWDRDNRLYLFQGLSIGVNLLVEPR